MKTLDVHVDTLRNIGDRFVNACKRTETGNDVEERPVAFFTWGGGCPQHRHNGLKLLRHPYSEGTEGINAFAKTLGRDYNACMKTSRRWRQLE
jgi:predicted transcriptional regulator